MNIKHIEKMWFFWPARQDGVGVDRGTGIPDSDPNSNMTDEETVELAIQFTGELGPRTFGHDQALRVYAEIRKLLNDEDRGNT